MKIGQFTLMNNINKNPYDYVTRVIQQKIEQSNKLSNKSTPVRYRTNPGTPQIKDKKAIDINQDSSQIQIDKMYQKFKT